MLRVGLRRRRWRDRGRLNTVRWRAALEPQPQRESQTWAQVIFRLPLSFKVTSSRLLKRLANGIDKRSSGRCPRPSKAEAEQVRRDCAKKWVKRLPSVANSPLAG
jgi:hypothetical protein